MDCAEKIKLFLDLVSVAAAALAALKWYRSATVEVQYKEPPVGDGMQSAAIIVNGADFVETSKRQSQLGREGAMAAAWAAAAQAASIGIGILAKLI
ncbi:hypothetical protein [Delftia acidovorans]|uniref:hypothetical protein n=1 Tax=Delftia acidovorans TaxID=80866 RepID=UPI00286EFEDE|nr:hypothetical protein [Delftia acidovorans]